MQLRDKHRLCGWLETDNIPLRLVNNRSAGRSFQNSITKVDEHVGPVTACEREPAPRHRLSYPLAGWSRLVVLYCTLFPKRNAIKSDLMVGPSSGPSTGYDVYLPNQTLVS
jgi:hypothetical protein